MSHHKRRRPKNQRSGCLMCKPWKGNGLIKHRPAVVRANLTAREQEREREQGQ